MAVTSVGCDLLKGYRVTIFLAEVLLCICG